MHCRRLRRKFVTVAKITKIPKSNRYLLVLIFITLLTLFTYAILILSKFPIRQYIVPNQNSNSSEFIYSDYACNLEDGTSDVIVDGFQFKIIGHANSRSPMYSYELNIIYPSASTLLSILYAPKDDNSYLSLEEILKDQRDLNYSLHNNNSGVITITDTNNPIIATSIVLECDSKYQPVCKISKSCKNLHPGIENVQSRQTGVNYFKKVEIDYSKLPSELKFFESNNWEKGEVNYLVYHDEKEFYKNYIIRYKFNKNAKTIDLLNQVLKNIDNISVGYKTKSLEHNGGGKYNFVYYSPYSYEVALNSTFNHPNYLHFGRANNGDIIYIHAGADFLGYCNAGQRCPYEEYTEVEVVYTYKLPYEDWSNPIKENL